MAYHQFQPDLGDLPNPDTVPNDVTSTPKLVPVPVGSAAHDPRQWRLHAVLEIHGCIQGIESWEERGEHYGMVAKRELQAPGRVWEPLDLRRACTGGKKAYTKTFDRERIVNTKKLACLAHLTVKTYLDTSTVLGRVSGSEGHNHPLGADNAIFTRLSVTIRAEIEQLLRLGVKEDMVVHDYT